MERIARSIPRVASSAWDVRVNYIRFFICTACMYSVIPTLPKIQKYFLAFCFYLHSSLFSLSPLCCVHPISSFLACLQEWASEFPSSLHWISSAESLLIHERLHDRTSFTDSMDMYMDNIDTSNSLIMVLKDTIILLGPYFHTPKCNSTPVKQCEVSKMNEEEAEAKTMK